MLMFYVASIFKIPKFFMFVLKQVENVESFKYLGRILTLTTPN